MDSINNGCKMSSDAWLELQAFKSKQMHRREKLTRHKNLHKDLINGIPIQPNSLTNTANKISASSSSDANGNLTDRLHSDTESGTDKSISSERQHDSKAHSPSSDSQAGHSKLHSIANSHISNEHDRTQIPASSERPRDIELVECLLLMKLCDVALKLPIDSKTLQKYICKMKNLDSTPLRLIENLLQKFAHQELISIEEPNLMLSDSKHAQKDCVDNSESDDSCIYVTSADHTKLLDFDKSFGADLTIQALIQESRAEELTDADVDCQAAIQKFSVPIQTVRSAQRSCTLGVSDHRGSSHGIANFEADSKNSDSIAHRKSIASGDDVETLLSLSSTKERESKKLGEELLELLSKPTAKEKNLLESFRSADGYRVQEFCPKGTKDECKRANKVTYACDRLHFKKIIARHTEEQLGDCSFLNTCFHMDSCKYVHYKVDYDNEQQFKRPHPADAIIGTTDRSSANTNQYSPGFTTAPNQCANQKQLAISDLSSQKSHVDIVTNLLPTQSTSKDNQLDIPPIDFIKRKRFKTVLHPPQWIQCDLRFFDMSLLGKFSVVMADPPWDIHMELPYGTMSDDEMRKLNIPALQDDGVIFLWVTGRAMELGRECLALWGYERCDEIIWVKTNQLQRIIRTGRTGHWLNHGKEHCLVGVKGNPKDINRGLDCDVIVAEVRATSHKPDEIYGIIERLSPGTRKIELFGRAHNVQPNWITLGNQLNGVQLIEPDLVSAFKNLYKG